MILKRFLPGLLMLCTSCSSSPAYIYPQVKISETELSETVAELTQTDKPRNYQNTDILNSLSQSIHDKLTSYGYTPEFQTFSAKENKYRNVIARFGPAGTPKIIVGAHYDCHADTPGADDNASGVAGLLMLAKLMKPYEAQLKKQIEFVAFTLEEPPFFRTDQMGSHVHAKSIKDSNDEVSAMICLEMIGYFTNDDDTQEYPVSAMKLLYPSTGDFVAIVSNFDSSDLGSTIKDHFSESEIEVQRLVSPSSLPGVDFSDHLNYWRYGYPAVMVTDTAFFRNANYHCTTDTIDTLDFTKMKELVRGVFHAVLNLGTQLD